MRNLIIKLATWAFLLGLVLSGYGVWEIYKQRNVSTTPEVMEIGGVADPQGQMVYASIQGGVVDYNNTYEYSLTTKNDVKLNTEYYVPVINEDTEKVVYILKLGSEPTIAQMALEANFTGLLSSSGEIPEDLRVEFKKEYPGQTFLLLDSTYEPKAIMEKLLDLKIFFILMIGGLIIRLALSSKSTPQQEMDEPGSNPNP